MATHIPSEGLRIHALLSEGEGKAVNVTVDGKPRAISLASGFTWGAGHVAAKAFKSQPGAVVELADVGDFEKDQGFSYGAWVKFNKNGAGRGRHGPHGRQGTTIRGWDLWMQGGRVAAHIINKWPEDALKVVSKNPINEDAMEPSVHHL